MQNNQSATVLVLSVAASTARLTKAGEEFIKIGTRIRAEVKPLIKEAFRPSVALLRGFAKYVEAKAEILEGVVDHANAWVNALPGVTQAVKNSQDARGALTAEDLEAAITAYDAAFTATALSTPAAMPAAAPARKVEVPVETNGSAPVTHEESLTKVETARDRIVEARAKLAEAIAESERVVAEAYVHADKREVARQATNGR